MTEEFRVSPPGVPASKVYTPDELARFAAARKAKEAKAKRKDTARRRWTLLNAFVDRGMAGLKFSDVAVWMALFRNSNADGVATVARTRIKALTGCDIKTIAGALSRLTAEHWAVRIQRGGPVGGMAVYRLQAPKDVGEKTDQGGGKNGSLYSSSYKELPTPHPQRLRDRENMT